MTKQFTSLWRRIVGRIKNNMPTIQITVAMALITIGFVFMIWGVDRHDVFIELFAIGIIVLGMCSWYASLNSIKKEEDKNREEKKVFLKVIKSIDRQMKGLHKNLKSKEK